MFKIKHERTADCVVAGYRVHKSGPDAIGSLLLGLYGAGRPARLGRGHRRLPDGSTQGALRGAPTARRRVGRAPVELGGAVGGGRRRAHAAVVGVLPLEQPEGPVVRAARGPSGSSRCATTTWRARASGTRRSSSGGARTARPSRAPSTSSTSRSATTSPTCCLPAPGEEAVRPGQPVSGGEKAGGGDGRRPRAAARSTLASASLRASFVSVSSETPTSVGSPLTHSSIEVRMPGVAALLDPQADVDLRWVEPLQVVEQLRQGAFDEGQIVLVVTVLEADSLHEEGRSAHCGLLCRVGAGVGVIQILSSSTAPQRGPSR